MNLMTWLLVIDAKATVYNMETLFARLINDIASIVVQRNHNNDASDEDILKVLPHNLYALLTSFLCISIYWHKFWLESIRWDAQFIEDNENNHRAIIHAYCEELNFKDAIDKCSNLQTKFHVRWAHCNGQFPQLQEFGGKLASIFLT